MEFCVIFLLNNCNIRVDISNHLFIWTSNNKKKFTSVYYTPILLTNNQDYCALKAWEHWASEVCLTFKKSDYHKTTIIILLALWIDIHCTDFIRLSNFEKTPIKRTIFYIKLQIQTNMLTFAILKVYFSVK